jgi:hypothetical protein
MKLKTVNGRKGKTLICHMSSSERFTGTICTKLINVPDKADSGM